MASTFMTHRQMSEAEAYYKIFQNLTLKYSNMDTVFIPSDKKEMRSKFLMKVSDEDKNKIAGIEVKGGREGLFLEKPDIIDKFCRREITDRNPELKAMCSVQFGKMFEPIRGSQSDEKEYPPITNHIEPLDDNVPWIDEEDRLANFYITTNKIYNKKRLPDYIKLINCQPGEVTIWRKRSFPKAARIHKKKEDTDPNRYFLSELMLYHGFTDE